MGGSKEDYKAFLLTPFWLAIREQKLILNPRCERCSSGQHLQCHHKWYRDRWEDTELMDLETLCKGCHRKEHGIDKPAFTPKPTSKKSKSNKWWKSDWERVRKLKIV